MKMKHILLLSIAMAFAAPAWAADATSAPAATQPATQAATPAEGTSGTTKHAPKKHAKKTADGEKAQSPAPTGLNCVTGCSAQNCGGVQVCAKNKPYPACTAC